ncbi:alpha/beta hydrolase [Bosea sp. BK604]|uniref:alpha/beta fold hydrolase n=1 Tax=Bosea sp. BK604 TaxID=2512180 RepID=UPI00104B85C3|nr:alpha/beta hydrolase [Bosea sp. BK604]TCR70670.1 pimeloyl-ACP methyl ester carboxylesterase [Bosea sp. BK604]
MQTMLTRAVRVFPILIIVGLLLLLRTEWLGAVAERQNPAKGTFFQLPAGRLHYVERKPKGEARGTVVLLHGASSDHADLLAALGPELGHYRVLAFDRPGLGWSDRLEGRAMADPARQADVIMQVLDRIAPEPIVLVAHSLAGAMSTRIALERPERVRGLVLLGAVTHPWPGDVAWHYRVASWPVIGPVFTRLVAIPALDLKLSSGVQSVFAPRPVTPGYVEAGEIKLLMRPRVFEANAQDLSALKDFVTRQAPRYRELRMPVVAITGDSDSVVSPVLHSAAIAGEAPLGRFVLLPGVGHMPHHAAPEIIVAAIDQIAGPSSGLALAR